MSMAGGTVESISKMVWLCARGFVEPPQRQVRADHPRGRDRRYRVELLSGAKLGRARLAVGPPR
jgi:hypothetical protein